MDVVRSTSTSSASGVSLARWFRLRRRYNAGGTAGSAGVGALTYALRKFSGPGAFGKGVVAPVNSSKLLQSVHKCQCADVQARRHTLLKSDRPSPQRGQLVSKAHGAHLM